MRYQQEVSPLLREVMLPRLNPYPSHYRMAFASSRVLYPHRHWRALRHRFPLRERYGLTTFRTRTMDEEGSACPPVALHLREAMGEYLRLATYLLVQA